MVKDNMSELITNTRTFLHRTLIEPVNYTGEMPDSPEKNRKWLKRTMLAAVGYLAFVAVDNATFYYETARVSADDQTMLYDIEGCEPFPAVAEEGKHDEVTFKGEPLTEAEKQALLDIEFEFKGTESAAKNFERSKFNPLDFILDWVEIHKHEKLAFTSEISGLDVHIYSDTDKNPFVIEDKSETIGAIDELIHSSLDESVEYSHVGVDAYVDCLRERFIDEDGPRELEDERLNIYVPSKPGVCFSNGLVQEFPDDATYGEFCDSVGATKEIRIAIRPFYEYRRNWMVIMTTSKSPEVAEYKLSKILVHEPTHFLMETAGMPFRITENERLAEYIEQQVITQIYHDDIPLSLAYPDEVYLEISE
jgi:hypothetical protein